MSFNTDDTICAIATAAGGAARGMVRISGKDAVKIALRLFDAGEGQSLGTLRRATATRGHLQILVDAASRRLPCDLFIWPTHQSYTREPTVELHTLGAPPLLTSLLNAICEAGARLAEPGEFTLRAFLAGRLDLTQAEAVLGVIDARGSEDLETSLVQLAGGLARPLHRLREELLQLLAELEAGLDFVEEDIEFISSTELHNRLDSAGRLLNDVLRQMASRNTSRGPTQIALVGRPNAGKSSLFNAMVERYGSFVDHPSVEYARALVSSQRGTTRDYLSANISLRGIECELIDTAGIDGDHSSLSAGEPSDPQHPTSEIDRVAQSVAAEQRQQATIRAYCLDAQEIDGEAKLRECSDQRGLSGNTILVLTKADAAATGAPSLNSSNSPPRLLTSSRTGQGLDALAEALVVLIGDDESAHRGQVVAATATRCRESLRLAQSSIERAANLVSARGGNELVAVELRAALEELGGVVGALYTDDLLDRIFGTFCIGK